jgi:hypothetical protein
MGEPCFVLFFLIRCCSLTLCILFFSLLFDSNFRHSIDKHKIILLLSSP